MGGYNFLKMAKQIKKERKLSKLQKALLESVLWQLERGEYAIEDFGKYKRFRLSTLKSLVDRGILCYSYNNNNYFNSSQLGDVEGAYYIKKQNK